MFLVCLLLKFSYGQKYRKEPMKDTCWIIYNITIKSSPIFLKEPYGRTKSQEWISGWIYNLYKLKGGRIQPLQVERIENTTSLSWKERKKQPLQVERRENTTSTIWKDTEYLQVEWRENTTPQRWSDTESYHQNWNGGWIQYSKWQKENTTDEGEYTDT